MELTAHVRSNGTTPAHGRLTRGIRPPETINKVLNMFASLVRLNGNTTVFQSLNILPAVFDPAR